MTEDGGAFAGQHETLRPCADTACVRRPPPGHAAPHCSFGETPIAQDSCYEMTSDDRACITSLEGGRGSSTPGKVVQSSDSMRQEYGA